MEKIKYVFTIFKKYSPKNVRDGVTTYLWERDFAIYIRKNESPIHIIKVLFFAKVCAGSGFWDEDILKMS